MPWVQLREKSQTEEERWHPLAGKSMAWKESRRCSCSTSRESSHYVDAREGLEGKIAKLIAEPAKVRGSREEAAWRRG